MPTPKPSGYLPRGHGAPVGGNADITRTRKLTTDIQGLDGRQPGSAQFDRSSLGPDNITVLGGGYTEQGISRSGGLSKDSK
jgi:hypothetical protein